MEEVKNTSNETVEETKAPAEETKAPTVEELMEQLAKANAEKDRYKNANDKLSSENASYKKKERERMTAEEQALEARKEHDEYVKNLEKELALGKAKNRYSTFKGLSAEEIDACANAELDGDMNTVLALLSKANDTVVKAKEKEWLNSRPQANFGVGSENTDSNDPFLKGFGL